MNEINYIVALLQIYEKNIYIIQSFKIPNIKITFVNNKTHNLQLLKTVS